MKSQQVRQQFLDFFQSKSHKIVPSAPMVNKDDPTLMFVNAGMNPFKDYFLGNKVAKDRRVADTQKCLRVSGKHNDLEEVGIDTYHHTLFEMLGNWSFGDYFKKEAIDWAWEFLTDVMKIDKDNLYVTVFEGAEDDGLEVDQEAIDLWKHHISSDRILMGSKKDNFWEMGDQGPCGPCSEIHVDIRSEEDKAKVSGADLVNQDHPQVIEVWNLVFIQFNRMADGSLQSLPEKHVDTGMGFERLCMVVQGVQSNYDTDVFTPLIREIETITQHPYGKNEQTDIAIRVIADHIRAVAFSIADGQLPSNTGAGYVIRRILRRAIRYGYTFLKQDSPFIYQLVATLTRQMGDSFPELVAQNNLIVNVIKEEEQAFQKTLAQGLVLLDNLIKSAKDKTLSGAKAFELYDTFGFPLDLTALILRERGLDLDQNGFEAEMTAQKARSRAATKVTTDDWVVLKEDDEEEFVGYDQLEVPVRITKYRKVQSKKEGDFYQFVFSLTPFYPESGGQVGDKGYLEAENGDVTYIIDTKKENNLIVHIAKELPRQPEGHFKAVVDVRQRHAAAANHTATHLLHQALREVLGAHVEQKGSMVHSGYLRFDFSHFSKLTSDELTEVEAFVNARIREQLPLEENRNTPYQAAIDSGAMALFGEKYGDTVRTIRFGESVELCGGTHVSNTSDIWHFTITTETAVASGIRRIEAITAETAKKHFQLQSQALAKVKSQLKNPQDLSKAVDSLLEQNAHYKKQLENLRKTLVGYQKNELIAKIKKHKGVNFLAYALDTDASGLKDMAFALGAEVDDLVLVLGSVHNGKPLLACYVAKNLVDTNGLNANTMVRQLGSYIQGGGGGQAFFATAGGKNPNGIKEALKAAEDLLG